MSVPETQPTALVLTALPLEYAAVRVHVEKRRELVHPDGTRVEKGQLPGTPWHIAIAELGRGAERAAALTTQLINWLHPEAMLFVGVAGSLKDDVGIGDVVVGTQVYEIHGGKQTPEGFQVRPKALPGSHALEQAARSAVRDMPDVRAHFMPIATGAVVLADAESETTQYLRRSYNDAGAIEMEGFGAAHAAHLNSQLHALVIRGISDRADAGKRDADAAGSQQLAARQAAAVKFALLRKHQPRKGSPVPSDSEEVPNGAGTAGRRTAETTSTSGAAPSTAPSPARATGDGKDGRGTTHGPVPRATSTLPPRPLGFTGRSAELDRLLPHLSPGEDDRAGLPLLIFAVTGMGGIGKTALALEAAHRAHGKGWFPGKTLFVDLRGYDEDPVTADQAVLALLDALGVRDRDLPATSERQYDVYRALLAERRDRMLLILDNASDPSQYLPLLPGTDHHRVLITSRDRPDALSIRLIDLETLAPDDSVALVTRALHDTDERDERPVREPDALRELVNLCGHLPLALQIAAGMLRRRRHRDIASLVAEVKKADDPTAVLDHGSPGTDLYGRSLVLRPVLETSYRRLPADQARLLRLLCLAPGAETGTEAVAALADLETDVALPLLEELDAAHLVSPVPSADGSATGLRWRVHDLVRAFGAGVVARDAESREEGETARERVQRFYVGRTYAASRLLSGLQGDQEPFTDRAQAVAWLDEERAGLVAAVQWAREERFADSAALLADCLAQYLNWRRHFDDAIAVAHAAREAALHAGDRHREAGVLNNLGIALSQAGRTEEAIVAHTRARDLFQDIGDRREEAGAWGNIGNALGQAGRAKKAIVAHTRARDLFQDIGDRRYEAWAWVNLGVALRDAGRTKKAIEAHTRARNLFQDIGDGLGMAKAWGNLGNALRREGDVDESIEAHQVARALFQACGDRYGEATEWGNIGNALGRAGRVEEAIEAHDKSLEIFREFEDWYGQGVTLDNLAVAHKAVHHHAQARSAFLQAADAFTRANAPAEAAHSRARAAEQPE